MRTPAYSTRAVLSIPLVFGMVLMVFGVKFILQAEETNNWLPTKAIVSQVNLIETTSSTNTTSSKQKSIDITVLYHYQVNGITYQSDKYSYGEGKTIKSRLKNKTIAQQWLETSPYQTDNEINIYYNPNKPQQAVIKIGANIWTFFPLVTGFLITVLFGLILWNKLK